VTSRWRRTGTRRGCGNGCPASALRTRSHDGISVPAITMAISTTALVKTRAETIAMTIS